MQSKLNPYISFKNNAREAMEFYKSVFGGKLEIATFKDYKISQDPGEDDLVMHSMLQSDNGISFMAADTPKGMEYQEGSRISMTLSGDNQEELKGYWEKLSVGGTTMQPLDMALWGDWFGMFIDKYGVVWMINITGKK